jgi:hypothetical protein
MDVYDQCWYLRRQPIRHPVRCCRRPTHIHQCVREGRVPIPALALVGLGTHRRTGTETDLALVAVDEHRVVSSVCDTRARPTATWPSSGAPSFVGARRDAYRGWQRERLQSCPQEYLQRAPADRQPLRHEPLSPPRPCIHTSAHKHTQAHTYTRAQTDLVAGHAVLEEADPSFLKEAQVGLGIVLQYQRAKHTHTHTERCVHT